jgi:hypothetical protein
MIPLAALSIARGSMQLRRLHIADLIYFLAIARTRKFRASKLGCLLRRDQRDGREIDTVATHIVRLGYLAAGSGPVVC